MRWQGDDGGSPLWRSVIEQACAAAQVDRHAVTAAVAAMALPLSTLFDDARALGIEERFLAPMNKALDNVRAQLENL